uniref:6-phosphofructokinase n=1 Tax=Timema cristinae TaxID=61476 RepID=A0A7R9CPJ9_TIMCR|nr:unnamed protein product [Timema cristinae]
MFCDTFVVYCCILTCKVKLTFYRPIVENMLGVKVQPKGKEFELTLQLKKSASKPEQNSQLRKTIAVLTSGGDSQGMNATVRAVVRVGMSLGCRVYFIMEGFRGMVDGGDNIVEAQWASVSAVMHLGGTMIGSARCLEFKERRWRLQAAKNLIKNGITSLVVIGGDGSLTGANTFKTEWPSMLEELVRSGAVRRFLCVGGAGEKVMSSLLCIGGAGEISQEKADETSSLQVVGLVASIDNDFHGTDVTIGCDSALHRITEAADSITSTASSHQRTFVMEVMGRHCGYLAIKSGMATEADYVFIPEDPPDKDWPEKLCDKLTQERRAGKRLNIIIVCEGSVDSEGNPITSDQIKTVVVNTLGHDTRVAVLGHVQRGGRPSAFDRVLGSRMGAEAVMVLTKAAATDESMVISLTGNETIHRPLMDCVQRTTETNQALVRMDIKKTVRFTVGLLHVGRPSCGMNAAVWAAVRKFSYHGYKVIGIRYGIEGFEKGDRLVNTALTLDREPCLFPNVHSLETCQHCPLTLDREPCLFPNVHSLLQEMGWASVSGWVTKGGANLGISSTVACSTHDEIIALRLRENKIQALLFIGGFEVDVAKSPRSQLCLKVMCWVKKELLAKSPRSQLCLKVMCWGNKELLAKSPRSQLCLKVVCWGKKELLAKSPRSQLCLKVSYLSVLHLEESRSKHVEFRIPLVVIPATISNRVPGTELTIGADTCVNDITEVRQTRSCQITTTKHGCVTDYDWQLKAQGIEFLLQRSLGDIVATSQQ